MAKKKSEEKEWSNFGMIPLDHEDGLNLEEVNASKRAYIMAIEALSEKLKDALKLEAEFWRKSREKYDFPREDAGFRISSDGANIIWRKKEDC